jgi:hypothetical protein
MNLDEIEVVRTQAPQTLFDPGANIAARKAV